MWWLSLARDQLEIDVLGQASNRVATGPVGNPKIHATRQSMGAAICSKPAFPCDESARRT